MPEKGWARGQSICCDCEDLPDLYVSEFTMYAQYDEESRDGIETKMFLAMVVLSKVYSRMVRLSYFRGGNKQQLLEYLADESHASKLAEKVISLSERMQEGDEA